jgi:hypothetical protein
MALSAASPASVAFMVMFSRLMSYSRAANRRADNAMMARVMAGDSAHNGPLKTAFGARGAMRGDHAKD